VRGDCYVSLHRGEGWGYPLFEAACRGKPVIATNYSGPIDYLDADHHYLVPYRLVSVAHEYMDFKDDMVWADPDVSQATSLMRYVYEHREEARSRAKDGARLLNQKYSLDNIGQMAAQRLQQLS
jgi:glycosyltransferase involved in cell wall biosynthesis